MKLPRPVHRPSAPALGQAFRLVALEQVVRSVASAVPDWEEAAACLAAVQKAYNHSTYDDAFVVALVGEDGESVEEGPLVVVVVAVLSGSIQELAHARKCVCQVIAIDCAPAIDCRRRSLSAEVLPSLGVESPPCIC